MSGLDLNLSILRKREEESVTSRILSPNWICDWICIHSLSRIYSTELGRIIYKAYALKFNTPYDDTFTDHEVNLLIKSYEKPLKTFIQDSIHQKVYNIIARWENFNNNWETRFIFCIPSEHTNLFNQLLNIQSAAPDDIKRHELIACQSTLLRMYADAIIPYEYTYKGYMGQTRNKTVPLSREVVDKYISIIKAFADQCFSDTKEAELRYTERFRELLQHLKTMLLLCPSIWTCSRGLEPHALFSDKIVTLANDMWEVKKMVTSAQYPELQFHQIVCMSLDIIEHFMQPPYVTSLYTEENMFLITQLLQEMNAFSDKRNQPNEVESVG